MKKKVILWSVVFILIVLNVFLYNYKYGKNNPTDQLSLIIAEYSKNYDIANAQDIQYTNSQVEIWKQLDDNVKNIYKTRVEKCINSGIAERIRKYFNTSYQIPTSDVIDTIKKEVQVQCDTPDKFAETKSEIIKNIDGKIILNNNTNEQVFQQSPAK